MGSFRAVRQGDIRLGEPLPFSIFDRGGILLLKEGFTINLQRQLDVLLTNGVYFAADERRRKRALDPRGQLLPRIEAEAWRTFETMDLLKLRLQRVFEHYRQGSLHDEFLQHVDDLALTVQEACTHDTDAALANLHLDFESSYTVVHHMHAAVLCELIGKQTGLADELRLVLVKAALTHDLGLIGIQDSLEHQTEELTAGQRARVRAHPVDGVDLLGAHGVTDPIWLDAVRHHHERLDGSGYPDGLQGEQMTVPMRVLALADIYSAMVRDRPYRKALVSQDAMRSLLLDRGAKTDDRLSQMLIKELGVFSPGVIVKLADGQVAVVKERGANSVCPIVHAFVRADGVPLMRPLRCDTAQPEFAIVGIVSFVHYKNCASLIRGLWLRKGAR